MGNCKNLECKNKINIKEKNGKIQLDCLSMDQSNKIDFSTQIIPPSKESSQLTPNISKIKPMYLILIQST